MSIVGNKTSINLVNDIGPGTKIELLEYRAIGQQEENVLICSKTFETADSCPNSPMKEKLTSGEFEDDTGDEDKDRYEIARY